MGFQSNEGDRSFANAASKQGPGHPFESLDELFAAGESVQQLLTHPGWAHVMRLVERRADEVTAQLDGRLLDSRAHYARLTGERAGLRAAHDAAHAIVHVAARELVKQQAKHEGAAEPAPMGVMA